MEGSIMSMTKGVIFLVVGLVIVFLLLGALAPTLLTAADNISSSGLPLAGLYGRSGIVLIVLMAGVLVAIVVLAFTMFKSRGKS